VAQIIHRGNSRLVRIPLGSDPQSGRWRYHNHTVRGTKKDAQRYATAQQRRIDLGKFVEPTRKGVHEFFTTDWFPTVRHGSAGGRSTSTSASTSGTSNPNSVTFGWWT